MNEKGMKGHFGQMHKGIETSSDDETEDEDDSAPSSTARSSSSSSTMAPSKFICPNEKCKKDCSSGAGRARHLLCSAECRAAAEATKKKEKEKVKE